MATKATVKHGQLFRRQISLYLQQPTRSRGSKPKGSTSISELQLLLGLAPDEACPATSVTVCPVGSYPTISPLPCEQGGLFSAALSVAASSPMLLPVVNRRPFRRSPDFPLFPWLRRIMETATIYFLPNQQN